MAGYVAYRKSAWDAATAPQRAVLRTVLTALQLGDGALGTIGGVEWVVFADDRIDAKFVENIAWLNGKLAAFTDAPVRDYATTAFGDVEVPIRVWEDREALDENGDSFDPPQFYRVLVDTGETEIVQQEYSLGDPLTLAAEAQGAVAWFTARQDLPPGWVPDDGEV